MVRPAGRRKAADGPASIRATPGWAAPQAAAKLEPARRRGQVRGCVHESVAPARADHTGLGIGLEAEIVRQGKAVPAIEREGEGGSALAPDRLAPLGEEGLEDEGLEDLGEAGDDDGSEPEATEPEATEGEAGGSDGGSDEASDDASDEASDDASATEGDVEVVEEDDVDPEGEDLFQDDFSGGALTTVGRLVAPKG